MWWPAAFRSSLPRWPPSRRRVPRLRLLKPPPTNRPQRLPPPLSRRRPALPPRRRRRRRPALPPRPRRRRRPATADDDRHCHADHACHADPDPVGNCDPDPVGNRHPDADGDRHPDAGANPDGNSLRQAISTVIGPAAGGTAVLRACAVLRNRDGGCRQDGHPRAGPAHCGAGPDHRAGRYAEATGGHAVGHDGSDNRTLSDALSDARRLAPPRPRALFRRHVREAHPYPQRPGAE